MIKISDCMDDCVICYKEMGLEFSSGVGMEFAICGGCLQMLKANVNDMIDGDKNKMTYKESRLRRIEKELEYHTVYVNNLNFEKKKLEESVDI